jgi:alkane 1-monooxygenase
MSLITYSTALTIASLAAAGFILGGAWTVSFLIVVFGLVPILELRMRPDERNLSADEESERQESPLFVWLLWAVVPLQYGLMALYLNGVISGHLSGWSWVGATLTMGVCCGAYGINVAHELGHRLDAPSRFMAKALLLTSLYMHFFIEHNRGHHARVATPDDPASARAGETLYGFLPRSLAGGLRSAWEIEARRLERQGRGAWTLHNEALRYHLIQLATLAAVGWALGALALASFIAVALIGALMLETVNYIEHYGLARAPRARGGYEPVRPEHSWNSNHTIGRALLFELSRHSDHHAHPRRSYATLRHHPEAPQLPTGYPGMILLSLFPPLFIPYMERHLERTRQQQMSASPP